MSVSTLSTSNQNYLKAIWGLGEWSDQPVTASTVAARTGVKLSTASDAIRKLSEQGLIEHAPYGSVQLTATGRTYALAMIRRHRLIETFLVEFLGYTWDQVHDEAETLEHAVSDFMVDRIDERLGFPERDPHGDPIPRADGTLPELHAVRLTGLETGSRAVIERISDDDASLLQFLAGYGIGVGTEIATNAAAPFSDTVEIVVGDRTLPLGRTATDAVWVREISSS